MKHHKPINRGKKRFPYNDLEDKKVEKKVEISKYRFEKPSNFATRTKKGLHDPSREGLMIVFVLQNTRGNTRDTIESG